MLLAQPRLSPAYIFIYVVSFSLNLVYVLLLPLRASHGSTVPGGRPVQRPLLLSQKLPPPASTASASATQKLMMKPSHCQPKTVQSHPSPTTEATTAVAKPAFVVIRQRRNRRCQGAAPAASAARAETTATADTSCSRLSRRHRQPKKQKPHELKPHKPKRQQPESQRQSRCQEQHPPSIAGATNARSVARNSSSYGCGREGKAPQTSQRRKEKRMRH